MKTTLSTPDIAHKTVTQLWERRRELMPLVGGLALMYLLTSLTRGFFPGIYTFDPFDMGWLLIPEALAGGPLVALLSHRFLAPENDFAWSKENLFVKLLKASAYYYVLLILFNLGIFVTSQVIPALIGYVLGPALGGFYPLVVVAGMTLFLLYYARLLLVYPVLAGHEREALVHSMLMTKGKTRQIVSCLLLLGAPVLIPWIGASVYGGDWLNPSRGPGLLILPIIARSLLLTLGALLISCGACVIYEALLAEAEAAEGETDKDS